MQEKKYRNLDALDIGIENHRRSQVDINISNKEDKVWKSGELSSNLATSLFHVHFF